MICVSIKIKDSREIFRHSFPIRTRIQEIKNWTCEKLDLDSLETEANFYHEFGFHRLKPNETLFQNSIRDGSVLICEMEHTKFDRTDFFGRISFINYKILFYTDLGLKIKYQ